MQKVAVLGCGGSGKSYVARTLGTLLDAPVTHLDAVFYDSGWNELPMPEFEARQRALVAEPSWVIDGNYNATLPVRLHACDTVVFLDLPAATCLWAALVLQRHSGEWVAASFVVAESGLVLSSTARRQGQPVDPVPPGHHVHRVRAADSQVRPPRTSGADPRRTAAGPRDSPGTRDQLSAHPATMRPRGLCQKSAPRRNPAVLRDVDPGTGGGRMSTMASTSEDVGAAVELPWEPRAILRYRTVECRVRPDGSAYEAEPTGLFLVGTFVNTMTILASFLLTPFDLLLSRARKEVWADVFVDGAHAVSPVVRCEETWVAVGLGEIAVIAAVRLPLRDGPATIAEVAWVGPVTRVRVDRRLVGRDRLWVFFPDRSAAVLPVARGTSLPA